MYQIQKFLIVRSDIYYETDPIPIILEYAVKRIHIKPYKSSLSNETNSWFDIIILQHSSRNQ
jgi:hypothetical protein